MHRHLFLAVCLALGGGAVGCEDDEPAEGGEEEAGTSGSAGSSSAGRAAGGSGGRAAAGSAAAGTGGRAPAGGAGGAGGRAPAGGAGGTGGRAPAGGAGGAVAGGAGGAVAGGAGGAGGAASSEQDIVEVATAAGTFTQLTAALEKAGLVEALQGEGPFTVFAPSDAAFEALETAMPGVLDALTVEQLASILKYHVVSGAAVEAADLKNGQLVETLEGPSLAVDLSGDKPRINAGATVTTADIAASNGVIHVIDKVILPPGDIIEVATGAGTFTKLAEALTSADLVDALKGEGPFTVFAPTDAAFEALGTAPTGDALKNVLQYHVIEGTLGALDLKEGGAAVTLAGSPVLFSLEGGAQINDAKITITNLVAKNGVIHVIDAVIVPSEDDIVATAVAAGTFTQLANALTSADLVDELQAPGPFTVFAPTDAAFEALGTAPTGDALKNVLLYHVVNGAVGSGDLKAGSTATLLSGENVTIDLASGVKVNDATVTTANILTKNGIIHVIDKVLVPN
ncbi:MAG: fasciclin domain-containing protein [Polyangiales bacterium]